MCLLNANITIIFLWYQVVKKSNWKRRKNYSVNVGWLSRPTINKRNYLKVCVSVKKRKISTENNR